MNKFKVGDKVRIVNGFGDSSKDNGKCFVIDYVLTCFPFKYMCHYYQKQKLNLSNQHYKESELELVEDQKEEEFYKIGDLVYADNKIYKITTKWDNGMWYASYSDTHGYCFSEKENPIPKIVPLKYNDKINDGEKYVCLVNDSALKFYIAKGYIISLYNSQTVKGRVFFRFNDNELIFSKEMFGRLVYPNKRPLKFMSIWNEADDIADKWSDKAIKDSEIHFASTPIIVDDPIGDWCKEYMSNTIEEIDLLEQFNSKFAINIINNIKTMEELNMKEEIKGFNIKNLEEAKKQAEEEKASTEVLKAKEYYKKLIDKKEQCERGIKSWQEILKEVNEELKMFDKKK